MKQLELTMKMRHRPKFMSPKIKSIMAHYPDMFIMTFSIHIPKFALLSQSAQLLLNFCYATALSSVNLYSIMYNIATLASL